MTYEWGNWHNPNWGWLWELFLNVREVGVLLPLSPEPDMPSENAWGEPRSEWQPHILTARLEQYYSSLRVANVQDIVSRRNYAYSTAVSTCELVERQLPEEFYAFQVDENKNTGPDSLVVKTLDRPNRQKAKLVTLTGVES